MVRRLRRFLRETTYQLRGMAAGAMWLLKGIQYYQDRLRELEGELTNSAAEISEAEQRIVYTTVGMALTTWARMEETLVVIVEILLRSSPGKAGLIMYSIINFNVWLNIITDLYALEPELSSFQTRWNKISTRIRRIKDLRDRLAHECASSDHAGTPISVGATLRPSEFDVRQKTKLYTPLTLGEIHEFTATVVKIAEDAVKLSKDMLAELRASAEKSSELNRNHSSPSDAR